jgi:hypothetical protein
VAKAIGELEAEGPVKSCLLALFTFELTSSSNKNAPFKKQYETDISKYATGWSPEAAES